MRAITVLLAVAILRIRDCRGHTLASPNCSSVCVRSKVRRLEVVSSEEWTDFITMRFSQ